MSLRSRIGTCWRALTKRNAIDRQIHEELEFHLMSYAGVRNKTSESPFP
jgi:hypothetical protein